jgi:hypothetical protein
MSFAIITLLYLFSFDVYYFLLKFHVLIVSPLKYILCTVQMPLLPVVRSRAAVSALSAAGRVQRQSFEPASLCLLFVFQRNLGLKRSA